MVVQKIINAVVLIFFFSLQVANADESFFESIHKVSDFHDSERFLTDQVLNIGEREKLLNFKSSQPEEEKKLVRSKLDRAVQRANRIWAEEFKKDFSPQEIKYLEQLYGSLLFKKIEGFPQKLIKNQSFRRAIVEELKK